MATTLSDMRALLKDYLDDPRGVSFDTVKLNLLIREAIRWIVNEATLKDYHFRKKEYSFTTTIGTATYNLPLGVRHLL